MVTLAVTAFVLVVAVPSFSELIGNNRLTTAANDLVASLAVARSEAIKQELPVTVCKSNDSANCVTTGNDWAQGWIVYFTDDGGNDVVLRVHRAIAGSVTMTGGSAVADSISYVPSGWSTLTCATVANCTIAVCDDRSGNASKEVVLTNTGRARVGTGAACP